MRGLKLCHVNAQSLACSRHHEELRQLVTNDSIDVVAVSETWLNKCIPDNSVTLPNYNIIRHDCNNPKKNGGGGGCLYIGTAFNYSIVDSSRDSDTEYLFVKITVVDTVILVCVVCRPPLTLLPESFVDAYSNIAHCFENVVILGDFNSTCRKLLLNLDLY